MQVSLTTMICVYMFGNKSIRDDKDLTSNNPDLQNSPYILLTRFICAIILHLQIEPKICQSINLMRFSFNRTANAARKFPQFTVALMQFTAAMATEIINMVVICIETDPSNIVQNLLAFGVICLIDDFYV
jgi:hypothetical protein